MRTKRGTGSRPRSPSRGRNWLTATRYATPSARSNTKRLSQYSGASNQSMAGIRRGAALVPSAAQRRPWANEPALLRAQGQVGFGFGVDEGLAVDVDDDAVEAAGEAERSAIVVDDRHRPVVAAGQAGVGDREARRREPRDVARADLVAVDEQGAA